MQNIVQLIHLYCIKCLKLNSSRNYFSVFVASTLQFIVAIFTTRINLGHAKNVRYAWRDTSYGKDVMTANNDIIL